MLGNEELKIAREQTKITALKWNEMTEKEQQLVLVNNAPNIIGEALEQFIKFITNSNCYYFDRLGNIYTYTID